MFNKLKDVVFHEEFEDKNGKKINICTGFDGPKLVSFTVPFVELSNIELVQILKKQLVFINERKQL